jgi:methionyl aminopeptidase
MVHLPRIGRVQPLGRRGRHAGTARIRKKRMSDGWEVILTADGKNAAHYENTILITEGEPEVLTYVGD